VSGAEPVVAIGPVGPAGPLDALNGVAAVGGAAEGPESIADAAAAAFLEFMRGRGAVDEHLADQILVPAALVAAGLGAGPPAISRLTTQRAGERLLAIARVVEQFLEVEVAILSGPDGEAELRIAPRADSLVAALRAGRVPGRT
jgi:RNA 3'-terminal phosphate cyclase (ATP)